MARRRLDAYQTHISVTNALFDNIEFEYTAGYKICEPCAGQGQMASVIRQRMPLSVVVTNDIDRQYGNHNYCGDATDPRSDVWFAKHYEWTITNPPFSKAIEVLENALEHSNHVAMLLRLSFLEPTRRRASLLADPKRKIFAIMPLNPRPSFTDDGKTDSVTVAWVVWKKNWLGGVKYLPLTNWC
jgi:hypothetical protein